MHQRPFRGLVFSAAAATASATSSGAWAQAGPGLQVQHAAVRLIVVAEPRSDISVSVQHGQSRLPPLSVRREGSRIVVDGGLAPLSGGEDETISCGGGARLQDRRIRINGGESIAYGDLPVVTVHAPRDVRVAASGAVFGEVGATRSLALVERGCANWTIGPVQQNFSLSSTGSADIHGSDVGSLQTHDAGSGDIELRRVAGSMDLDQAGSGDVRAALVQGSLHARIAGSGDVAIREIEGAISVEQSGSGDVKLLGGHAPFLHVEVSGSATFAFGGQAGRVQAAVSGSGDIHVAHAYGPVSQARSGSGDITIGR